MQIYKHIQVTLMLNTLHIETIQKPYTKKTLKKHPLYSFEKAEI